MKRKHHDLPWTPFAECAFIPATKEKIAALAAAAKASIDFVRKSIRDDELDSRMFVNSRYTVLVKPLPATWAADLRGWPDMTWLSIRRNDRRPVRSWRDLQRIKNELVGSEHEAVELYPAESRLVDTSNQYHLWVLKTPGVCFPFGFRARVLLDHDVVVEAKTGTRQEAFER